MVLAVAEHLDAIYDLMKDHLAGCIDSYVMYVSPELE